jgi:hypothetical protein
MEAKCSSETSVGFQRTTWNHISEDRNLHNQRCENLKSYILISGFGSYVETLIVGYQCGFQRNINSNIPSVQCETGRYGLLFYSCLRHYATSRKAAGSIPDEVIGFSHYDLEVDSVSNRSWYQESSCE